MQLETHHVPHAAYYSKKHIDVFATFSVHRVSDIPHECRKLKLDLSSETFMQLSVDTEALLFQFVYIFHYSFNDCIYS